MSSALENFIARTPDVFSKEPDSNIYKLLQVIGEELDQIKQVNEDIRLARNIDSAEGMTLDNIGKNLELKRNDQSDEVYRLLLKLKIAAKGGATFPNLINIIAASLNIDDEDVFLINEKEFDASGEPASLLLSLSSEAIENSQIDYFSILNFLNTIIAGGVSLNNLFHSNTDLGINVITRYEVQYNIPFTGTINAGAYPYPYDTRLSVQPIETDTLGVVYPIPRSGTINSGVYPKGE